MSASFSLSDSRDGGAGGIMPESGSQTGVGDTVPDSGLQTTVSGDSVGDGNLDGWDAMGSPP